MFCFFNHRLPFSYFLANPSSHDFCFSWRRVKISNHLSTKELAPTSCDKRQPPDLHSHNTPACPRGGVLVKLQQTAVSGPSWTSTGQLSPVLERATRQWLAKWLIFYWMPLTRHTPDPRHWASKFNLWNESHERSQVTRVHHQGPDALHVIARLYSASVTGNVTSAQLGWLIR